MAEAEAVANQYTVSPVRQGEIQGPARGPGDGGRKEKEEERIKVRTRGERDGRRGDEKEEREEGWLTETLLAVGSVMYAARLCIYVLYSTVLLCTCDCMLVGRVLTWRLHRFSAQDILIGRCSRRVMEQLVHVDSAIP